MRVLPICALATAAGISAFAAESKINLSDLPPAVQTAVKNQTNGAKILGASQEREHGHMTYEVETSLNGKGRDLTFAENGTLQEVEQEVDLDSIPTAAKQAIQASVPQGTVKKVESVTHAGAVSYEADVISKNGKKREVAVNADGTLHKGD